MLFIQGEFSLHNHSQDHTLTFYLQAEMTLIYIFTSLQIHIHNVCLMLVSKIYLTVFIWSKIFYCLTVDNLLPLAPWLFKVLSLASYCLPRSNEAEFVRRCAMAPLPLLLVEIFLLQYLPAVLRPLIQDKIKK